MSNQPIEHPGASAWQSPELRLTAFPVDPAAAIERDWLQAAFGQSAESSTRNKLLRIDVGMIEDRAITVVVDPQRLTLTIQPALDPLNPPSSLPTLGALPRAIENVAGWFERLVSSLPEVRRLAFGAGLMQPADSHEAAYRLLGSYLPDVRVSPESTDFNYRINRSRASRSGIEGLRVNRLCTWSVIRWQMQGELGIIGGPSNYTSVTAGFACKLDLDINTDGERENPLPQDRLKAIWLELVNLGVEIADKGDVP
jgi:hypothetical protein